MNIEKILWRHGYGKFSGGMVVVCIVLWRHGSGAYKNHYGDRGRAEGNSASLWCDRWLEGDSV